jgi:hypothetical protein
MITDRRSFLLSSAAGAAVSQAGAAPPATLPKVKFGKYELSRLIVGANPFYGYSHFNRILDSHMREWCTPEKVCEVLRGCELNGINTWQFSEHERSLPDIRRHQETGGKLQWIVLSGRRLESERGMIAQVAKMKPMGIVHHGGVTDSCFRKGQMSKVQDFLKKVRQSGVMVGMSTHTPAVIEYVEQRNWDIDFYMTAVYCVTRPAEETRKMLGGELPLGEVYLDQDPARMYRVVRQTRKTCLAFKILAAGRRCDSPMELDRAFKFAFDSIKPQDCVIVGMYPRYSDQVKENADRVRRILSA